MTTVRVRFEDAPPTEETQGKGLTLAAAVRRAVWRMGLGPGRTIEHQRIDTHEHRWIWAKKDEHFVLRVRENRSGPSGGESSTEQVKLRLTGPELAALDNLAQARSLSRSKLVVLLVEEATTSAGAKRFSRARGAEEE